MSARAAEIRPSISTGSQNSLVRPESVQGAIFHVERDDANALAILHDQIEGEVFDEEIGVVTKGLAVECVKNGMACAIRGSRASIGLAALAKLEGLPTKCSLVYFPLLGPREWDAEMFELRQR
jgi:hypothetical protein